MTQKRLNELKVRLNDYELEQLKAKARHIPVARFMREFVLSAKIPKQRTLPKIDPEQFRRIAQLHNELSRIGNNVNQLTKSVHVNQDHDIKNKLDMILYQTTFIKKKLLEIVDDTSF